MARAYLGFFTISFFMRSMASSDMSWNISSGKSSLHCDMLQNVSCLVSPPNGEQPVNRTYIKTPMDLKRNNAIFSGNCAATIGIKTSDFTTCRFGRRLVRSWALPGPRSRACRVFLERRLLRSGTWICRNRIILHHSSGIRQSVLGFVAAKQR